MTIPYLNYFMSNTIFVDILFRINIVTIKTSLDKQFLNSESLCCTCAVKALNLLKIIVVQKTSTPNRCEKSISRSYLSVIYCIMIGILDIPELILLWGFDRKIILKTTNYGWKCGSKTIYMLLFISSDKLMICDCMAQYDLY